MNHDEFFEVWLSGNRVFMSRKDVLFVRVASRVECENGSKERVMRPLAALIKSSSHAGRKEDVTITEGALFDLLEGPHPFVDTGSGRWVPADNIDEFKDGKKVGTPARGHECHDWHPYSGRSWIKLNSGVWLPSVLSVAELEDELQKAYERALSVRSKLGLTAAANSAMDHQPT